jgi:hypothetical protein
MQITTILAFITAMGGLEAVKWAVRYITCRKTEARKEEASVSGLEEENRRKKVDWLEERLTLRDEKIDGLYAELRKEQEDKIDWIHKCHEVELVQKELEVKKCEFRGCAQRIPPSDY